jgi:predicted ATPase/DNA-binding CsgD family transcriptional regulator
VERSTGSGAHHFELAVDAVPGNLPQQATSFIGRQVELARVGELLVRYRSVTLTGVGGVGKTRLALHAAAEATEQFRDGVWLVELASAADPAAVPTVVAATLGIPLQSGNATDTIVRALDHRLALLLLDNCEHVLSAAAGFVEALLARTTAVTVLATSRESLRVAGEHVWAVGPLDVASSRSSAAELFVDRAQATTSTFGLAGEADGRTVAEICRQLDGIPLAIELAAARMVSMTPQEVLARLGDRFRLLSGGRREVQRHRTLRHAVDWSYELLDETERAVLRACSVFVDGWDVAAATAVCGMRPADDVSMLDVLDSLVRKSLVTANPQHAAMRYGMLETIRQYAVEQASTSMEWYVLRDRHAAWFAGEAARHCSRWDGPEQTASVEWVATEFANLRSAFHWAASRGDLQTATTIVINTALVASPGLQRYEHAEWAEEVLQAAEAARFSRLAELYLAASFCGHAGRPEDGVQYARKARALARENPSETLAVWIPLMEANGHSFAGRHSEHLAICRELAAGRGQARVVGLCGLCYGLSIRGRGEEARRIAAEMLEAAELHGNPFWLAYALGAYGAAFADSDPDRAVAVLRRALSHARSCRAPFWEASIGRQIAVLIAAHGSSDDALELLGSAIESFHRAGDIKTLAVTLTSLAAVFAGLGKTQAAMTLYGAAGRHIHAERLPEVQQLVQALGESVAAQQLLDGASMTLGEAVRYANRQIHAGPTGKADQEPAADSLGSQMAVAQPHVHDLTEREQQVLRVLGEGLSNKDMAERLFLSVRTVENHLAHIYAKLGVRGRLDAALLARTVFGEAERSSAARSG